MSKGTQTLVGVFLVILGAALHLAETVFLKERQVWDVVSLLPMLIGAHMMSSSFLKQVVAGMRARFGKDGDA